MKQCPFCAEDIRAEAIKCKHCGSDLTGKKPPEPEPQRVVVKQKKSGSNAGAGCLLLLLLFIGYCTYSVNTGPSRGSSPSTSSAGSSTSATDSTTDLELTARVSFTGTQFVVVNGDSFDWTNVEMSINYGVFSGGYDLTTRLMSAGESYTVGAAQFADSDGLRFNPLTMKPTKFMIAADTPRGKGYYFGGWE